MCDGTPDASTNLTRAFHRADKGFMSRCCKVCRAPQREMDIWCGACGSATPLRREEDEEAPRKRRLSAADHFRACTETLAKLKLVSAPKA